MTWDRLTQIREAFDGAGYGPALTLTLRVLSSIPLPDRPQAARGNSYPGTIPISEEALGRLEDFSSRWGGTSYAETISIAAELLSDLLSDDTVSLQSLALLSVPTKRE